MATFRGIVGLMRELDEKEHTTAKKNADRDWFKKAAEEADLPLDSDLDIGR